MSRGRRTAMVVGAVASVLLLLTVALRLGVGTGFSLAEDAGPAPALAFGQIRDEPPKLRAWVEFGELVARPLFNETRAPEEQPESADATAEGAAQPLNVQLTGVILAQGLQLALVRDTTNGETARVRVGQPLEGAMAGWKLVELQPRLAVFDGAGLGRQELPLTVDTKGAPPPPAPVAAAQPAPVAAQPAAPNAQPAVGNPAAPVPVAGQPASADEIRRRIEERRRQLREEAQKMLDQNQNN
jgi:general secretion pathway protein N